MSTIAYVSHPIPGDLAGAVAKWHGYRQRASMPMRHRAMPDPIVPLIFGFGAVHALESATQRIQAAAFGGGLIDSAVSVLVSDYHGLQVNLTPSAAARLVGVPGHELRGHLFGIDDLLGAEGRVLAEQLEAAPDWDARFELVSAFLRRRLDAAPREQPDIEHAWRLLDESQGRIGVGELARQVGWSQRHLRTRFRSHVGVGPKQAARLWRFQHAVRLLVDRPEVSLASVAHRTGFSDQSHLTNEVTTMSGLTPRELRAHGPGGVFED